MNARQMQTCQKGIVLLEVLIAFSILAISVCVLNSVGASAFRNLRAASDQLCAAQLASDLLAEFPVSRVSGTADRRGTYQDRFRWAIMATPSLAHGAPILSPGAAVLTRLQIDIEWGDDNHPRHYSINAVRILHVESAGNGAS